MNHAVTADLRSGWAIQLQYATITRAGSLLGVMPDDIRRSDQGTSIRFRVAKGDKPYDVLLGPKGLEAVDELLALLDYTPTRILGSRIIDPWRRSARS